MPEPIELESATNYLTAAWVVGAVVIAYCAGLLASWLVLREWLRREHPGALTRRRPELDNDRAVESSRDTGHVIAPQADSGLFTGSPEAERRSREFDVDVDSRDRGSHVPATTAASGSSTATVR